MDATWADYFFGTAGRRHWGAEDEQAAVFKRDAYGLISNIPATGNGDEQVLQVTSCRTAVAPNWWF